MSLALTHNLLKERAAMFAMARSFFSKRGILEVDCPLINSQASVDLHIDLFPVIDGETIRYLHTSPEYAMKRLLANGSGDIYQLGHVFRVGEYSQKHNPEFTMAEWYRLGFTFDQMIEETADFIRLFLGPLPSRKLTYREALKTYAGLDYHKKSALELITYLEQQGVTPYPSAVQEGEDALLNQILALFVEPELGNNELTILTHYPASQAALSKLSWHGDEQVGERFEIYYQGVELCNGYHELADPVEQRRRLEETNTCRIELGKAPLPIDERFISALEQGLPDCCGVAVGFDRLLMLKLQAKNLTDILPFDWHSI